MKKSHAGFWVGLSAFFLAAVYSVVLFLAKAQFDLSSWVLYGATMIAFLLFGVQMIASARSSRSVVTDTALGVVTAIYFVLQFLFGGIICMCFRDLPTVPVIILEIILLAAYLIFAFFMFAAQSSHTAQDVNDGRSIQRFRLLESDVKTMLDNTADPAVREKLSELAEAIHYTDRVSLPGLADVEDRIAQNVAVLQEELNKSDADPRARIDLILQLLRERDRTAAFLKR